MTVPHRRATAALYPMVFVTGAAVMVIELLGTRVIAPFYGTSLYVWSSLISVTMIALAVGYYLGGWWADRARRVGLSLIIALAGLCALCIPLFSRAVLLATDPLGLRGGAFVSSLLLFAPALTWLGMVGPFAIKLATARLEGVGSSAGSVYAVSTLGSVIGTLVLGFFLFPWVGSREILIGLGVALILLSWAAALVERVLRPATAVWPSLLVAVIGALVLPAMPGAARSDPGEGGFQVRSEAESLYGWVRVIDQPDHDLRLLTVDASTIGAAGIRRGDNRLAYQDIVGFLPQFVPDARRALLIGQGAGHMAMELKGRWGIKTDTIEVDPAVAAAAVAHFGFQPTGDVLIGDGRYVIRQLSGPYDLIVLDCFTGGSEPTHLLTVEALQSVAGLLSVRGVVSLNFVAFGDGGRNRALASVARTLLAVFPQQQVYVSEPGEDFNDYIFLASRQPFARNEGDLPTEVRRWLTVHHYPVDSAAGELLTDNRNGLEYLQVRKAEHYRHVLLDWFGPELFLR